MNRKTRSELELQLEKLQIIVTNIKISHDRIMESKRWNNSEIAQWVYNAERRMNEVNVLIKANKFCHRKYHRELKKAIIQNVIKKTNANDDWLKKHLIILT